LDHIPLFQAELLFLQAVQESFRRPIYVCMKQYENPVNISVPEIQSRDFLSVILTWRKCLCYITICSAFCAVFFLVLFNRLGSLPVSPWTLKKMEGGKQRPSGKVWLCFLQMRQSLGRGYKDRQIIMCFTLVIRTCYIWCSHGGEYEDGCVLGCSAL
jgi:hypothetical protein